MPGGKQNEPPKEIIQAKVTDVETGFRSVMSFWVWGKHKMLFKVEHLGHGILISCLVMEETSVMGTKRFYKKIFEEYIGT